MEKKTPKWKPIKMGERLPCQSFLRKKDGEILKLSTLAGIKVGQDAYYLPVDEVIEEIRNYPIEESEDEKIRKGIIRVIKGSMPDNDFRKQYIAWLEKQDEKKPAEWSVTDEDMFITAVWHIKNSISNGNPDTITESDILNWFESLKDRVQPKQEWSEEDEKTIVKMRKHFIRILGDRPDFTKDKRYEEFIEFIDNRLKSLRPQSHWKPSEEMLEALYRAIPENVMAISEDEMLLDKLYQGLKYGRVLSNK